MSVKLMLLIFNGTIYIGNINIDDSSVHASEPRFNNHDLLLEN